MSLAILLALGASDSEAEDALRLIEAEVPSPEPRAIVARVQWALDQARAQPPTAS